MRNCARISVSNSPEVRNSQWLARRTSPSGTGQDELLFRNASAWAAELSAWGERPPEGGGRTVSGADGRRRRRMSQKTLWSRLLRADDATYAELPYLLAFPNTSLAGETFAAAIDTADREHHQKKS